MSGFVGTAPVIKKQSPGCNRTALPKSECRARPRQLLRLCSLLNTSFAATQSKQIARSPHRDQVLTYASRESSRIMTNFLMHTVYVPHTRSSCSASGSQVTVPAGLLVCVLHFAFRDGYLDALHRQHQSTAIATCMRMMHQGLKFASHPWCTHFEPFFSELCSCMCSMLSQAQ